MILFWGWPLCPLLPRPEARILTYVGPGIDLPHLKEPTAQEVEHWHEVYLDALRELFYKNRAEAGFPDAELEIV